MDTIATHNAIGVTLLVMVATTAVMAIIDMIICLKRSNEKMNKKQTFGIITYLCIVISILLVFGYGTFAVYRYDNDLCSFDVNDECTGKCSNPNCKRSCSSIPCTKHGKECSESCNLLNLSIYFAFGWGSLGFLFLCYLLLFLGAAQCRCNKNGIYEQCTKEPTNNNYKREMELQIKITETQSEISEYQVLNILKSKTGIPQIFIHNIQTILQTPFPQSIDIANFFINAYFNDITRNYNLTLIVPITIISVCIDYFGINDSNKLCPRLPIKPSHVDINRLRIYSQLSTSFQNIVESEVFGRIMGECYGDIWCEKPNGMIVIDTQNDVGVNGFSCKNNGNVFIRCNNLYIKNQGIRTRQRMDDEDHKKKLKKLLSSVKRKEIKNNPNIFGNVILIVRNLLKIEGSCIYTGYLYINCGKLIAENRSYMISSREKSKIIVDGNIHSQENEKWNVTFSL